MAAFNAFYLFNIYLFTYLQGVYATALEFISKWLTYPIYVNVIKKYTQ